MGAPLPEMDEHTHGPACYDPIEPCRALLNEPLTSPQQLPTGAPGAVCQRCREVSVRGAVNPLALANGCDRRRMLDRCGGTLIPVSLTITYPDTPFYRRNT